MGCIVNNQLWADAQTLRNDCLWAFADLCVFHSHGYAPACGSSCRSQSVSSTTASLYQPASHAHGEWKGLTGRGPGTGEEQCTGVCAVKRFEEVNHAPLLP